MLQVSEDDGEILRDIKPPSIERDGFYCVGFAPYIRQPCTLADRRGTHVQVCSEVQSRSDYAVGIMASWSSILLIGSQRWKEDLGRLKSPAWQKHAE